jgi:hypothetical protein
MALMDLSAMFAGYGSQPGSLGIVVTMGCFHSHNNDWVMVPGYQGFGLAPRCRKTSSESLKHHA